MGSPGLEGMNGAGFVALLFAPAVVRIAVAEYLRRKPKL